MSLIRPTDILLPREEYRKLWSVVACDQFTSQPDYWERVERMTSGAPSSLRMVLPEAWLGTDRAVGAPERIAGMMEQYLSDGIFEEHPDCYIYLERTQTDGRVRRGLMGALDLERYDFAPRTDAPIRATEGTVAERIPPRVAVRAAARLEMPHVMVLMDDRDDRVLGPLENARHRMKKLYDFDLMMGGGHVTGWRVDGALRDTVTAALDSLGEEELPREQRGAALSGAPRTLAVGAGTHSLAAAKRWWDRLKETLSPAERETHPARYALVELGNIHEPALEFMPIHRLIYHTDTSDFAAMLAKRRQEWETPGKTIGERTAAADAFCRDYAASHGGEIDYIHGDDAVKELARRPGCAAVLLPPVKKSGLFVSILRDGALPRKSFSIGRGEDKRYYLECRRIK